jgi:tetratricopeptide (TPR) repeat protein
LRKSFLAALKEGKRAYSLHRDLLEAHPEYADARLAIGVNEYVVGSLPWYIKWLASLTGSSGSRSEGLRQLEQAAKTGNFAREDAKVVLSVLYQREGKNAEAAAVLEELARSYPRNFILRLDLAGAYRGQGNWPRVARVYDEMIEIKRSEGFEKLPWARLLYQTGDAYEKLMQPDRALRLYEQAAEQQDRDVYVTRSELAAGRLHVAGHRLEEARRWYSRVIAAAPDSKEGKQAREVLKRLRDQEKKPS